MTAGASHIGRMLEKAKSWARRIRRDVVAVWIAARDPRTPWSARIVAAAVAAYALSPIDLIPDVIPVFGYLDDLLVVPLGLLLAIRLIPPSVLAEARVEAARRARPTSLAGAVAIGVLWLAGAAAAAWWLIG